MDLFTEDQPINVLPKEGIANYFGTLISLKAADRYLNSLVHKIAWKHDEIIVNGRQVITRRKVAWHGDKPFKYSYSRAAKVALPWTAELEELKFEVEQVSGEKFNSCLLNLYHNGTEGMGWHCDNEKDLIKNGAIGSLSLGAERKFSFKHKKTKETVSVNLQHGSLLVMRGATQAHWLHSLPLTKNTKGPRVNLTFRTITEAIDNEA